MAFAPEYIRAVLEQQFEDAKALFLEPLVAIHYAHLVMLVECGIVERSEARRIRDALDGLDLGRLRAAPYDASAEDLFFYVERRLVEACGEDTAGRLHTARSRNDIDMAMYRMRLRELLLALGGAAAGLRRTLLDLADRHVETVFPAHTHTQPAQPTTVAHYALAIVEALERDAVRLRSAFATVNRSPLGACAITGTGFPIDRGLVARLLGFDGPTGNTYGSIAAADYAVESAAAAAVLVTGLGRLLQDLLFWCTAEAGYLRLGEGYVQASSIMPQKRNPVALEHARALASRALGQATAIFTAVHNTPFADIVDIEDDLQPVIFGLFRDATRATELTAAALGGAEIDAARMAAAARAHWITVTELADTLTREHGLSFRTSHRVVADFVARCRAEPALRPAEALARAAEQLAGRRIDYDPARLEQLLSPQHFVEVRRTPGGPAPDEARRAIAASRARLEEDRRWLEETAARLEQ
ncbi:MAG TPA: argininosuccinate lyase, partial [Vicinamibacterales bacterium]|nr:argininosuccinate lyase [Vicinamibacterales bacterium]